MRIHRLVLQALGPFPGRHEVDLDALSASGLFLLEGPTGAGKSTLIDAVVFALYGKVAGAEASDDRLHSHFAEPGVEPFVELTFSTAAGMFRVWRSPAFLRPKRRGGGFTQQNARARLWRLSDVGDAGEQVSAHVQEVGGELARVVVLDRAQFTQTVVLPQGQFASFLRARPEDRRAVLQDVFGTEIYERVQDQLAEMARAARAGTDRARAEVLTACESFVDAAGPLLGSATTGADAAEATTDDGLPTKERLRTAAATTDLDAAALVTDAVCETARRRATLAGARRDTAARAVADAQARLDAERELAALLARRAALVAEQRTLDARAETVATAEARLALARRAAAVTPTLDAHDRAAARAAAATRARDDVLAALAGGPDADLATLADLTDLRSVHDAARAEVGALAELVTLEAALDRRKEEVAAARDALADATADVAQRLAAVGARSAERVELEELLGGFRGAGSEFTGARAAATAARALLGAAETCTVLEAKVEAGGTALTSAAREAEAALEAEHAVRRRWIAGVAGALAGRLADGDACPVCGSCEHPAPAVTTPEHATEAQMEAAGARREEAEAALTEARTRLTAATEQLSAQRAAAQGLDVEAARERLAAADAAVTAAERAIYRSAELEQELADHDAETRRQEAELADLRERLATATATLEQRSARLAEDSARCAAARAGARSVAERSSAVAARADAARDLLDATTEHHSARRALDDAAAQVIAALSAARLTDAHAARSAALSDAELVRVEESVRRHRADVDRVRAGLAEVAALTGDERPDVAGAQAAHEAAMTALTETAGAEREATLLAARTAEAAERLLTRLAEHAEDARRVAPLLRAASLANAGEGNRLDTTLATYVLLRRFEDVVAAANDRLCIMSDGRYALERIDEREGGQRSRKAGLGLQVRDHLTETPRDPHTLSGGETFYVSLCLALGLADVVRAEAGGIELGTLFVDEGFGSLDPAALDCVMTELGRLREGGRAVGVVSHVAEMKERIAERIEVRRLPGGASTLRVCC